MMKRYLVQPVFILIVFASLLAQSMVPLKASAANNCKKSFLGLPTWYAYLEVKEQTKGNPPTTYCVITKPNSNDPIEGLDDLEKVIPNVVVAIVDLLLRVAGIVAFAFIVASGFRFVLAQGDPGKEKQARTALFNAVIGMLIAIFAATIITFIGRRLTS